MKTNFDLNINNQANTELLIDYLETNIADEMILNSFIRDLKIISQNNKSVVILVSSKTAQNIIKTDYYQQFNQAIEDIFERPLTLKIVTEKEEIIDEDLKNELNPVSKNISKKFNWSNYVISNFNDEAVNISKKILLNPGFFSPYFIDSKSGLGKTHLLHAIGNEFLEKGFSAAYIEPNQFTRNVQELSKQGGESLNNFINELTNFDLLLFDDIQYLGDRSVTLKVLFNVINKQIENDKQIVIVSDKVAQELSGFEERFITRFVSGISSTIKKPELDDLIKVLKFKLADKNLNPDQWEKEALKFIAHNNSNSIRALEGAVKRVAFFTMNENNIKYTYAVISSIFKELAIDPAELTPTRIINTVTNYYKINKQDLIGKSRKKEFVNARYITIWLIRKINNLSYVQIGKILGNRDHSTIINAIKTIEYNMEVNHTIKLAIQTIEQKIKSNK